MNLDTFADVLTERAVDYSDKPFNLRAGGESHWYIDHRKGLSRGDLEHAVGTLIVDRALTLGLPFERVAGGGVGGIGLAVVTGWIADERIGNVQWVIANLDITDTDDEQNGYGLHGGDVAGKNVLLVDDIGSTGSSLLELAEMVRLHGGHIQYAVTVSDRSQGKTARALADVGITYHPLLGFNEETGKLNPIERTLLKAQRNRRTLPPILGRLANVAA